MPQPVIFFLLSFNLPLPSSSPCSPTLSPGSSCDIRSMFQYQLFSGPGLRQRNAFGMLPFCSCSCFGRLALPYLWRATSSAACFLSDERTKRRGCLLLSTHRRTLVFPFSYCVVYAPLPDAIIPFQPSPSRSQNGSARGLHFSSS